MENLIYLTTRLNNYKNPTKELVKRLNDKGLKTLRGKEYTLSVVQNVLYGKSNDEKVRLELISLVAEWEGKQASVQAHVNAAKAILNI